MVSMEYSDDFKNEMGWNRACLRIVGIWPEPDDGIITKNKAWFIVSLIFVIIYLPQSASIFVFWGDMNAVIECLSINGPLLLAMLKISTMRYYRKVLRIIIEMAAKDWIVARTSEERMEMLKIAKICRKISTVSTILTSSLFVAYIIFRIWIGIEMKKDTNLDPRLSIGLPHPAYFPYDTNKPKYFFPTWIAQCISTFFCMTAYAAFDSFLSTVLLHLCGQMKIIGISLRNVINEAPNGHPMMLNNKFTGIIQYHERINETGKIIEDSFNFVLLAQMLICTFTFSCQGFGMISSLMMNSTEELSILEILFSIVYIFYTVLHLFIYCYVGDCVSVESTSISDSLYKSHWYELPAREARWLMLVGHRCRKPMTITAGKFCKFSRTLFITILKTSVGYLSMLLTLKKDK